MNGGRLETTLRPHAYRRVTMKIKRRNLVLAGLATSLPVAYLVTQPLKVPAEDMVLLDGSRLSHASFQGRITLVNFWATSCSICVAEMPAMVDTYQRYRSRGFSLVAVAMKHDAPSSVVHFSQTRELPFPVAIDNTGAVARAWGDVAVTPTSFLVDQRGNILKRFQGAPDFASLHTLIESLLTQA